MKPTLYRSDRLLAAMALFLASCSVQCTTGGEADKVAKQIAPAIAEQAGAPVEVTCPDLDPAKTNQCQGKTQSGQTFAVEVKKDGAAGTWDWEPKGFAFGKPVAENITKLYAEAHGIQLPGLACTGIIMEGSAEPATCQARVQGVEVVFDVKNGPDGATFTPRRGFVVSELASKLAVDELAKLGVQAEVDCGPALRISVPNSQFTCTAKDAGGETRPLYYRVTSDDGAIEVQSKPFE
jgi:hypothetical protein